VTSMIKKYWVTCPVMHSLHCMLLLVLLTQLLMVLVLYATAGTDELLASMKLDASDFGVTGGDAERSRSRSPTSARRKLQYR
jgi:hypothetical protein